MKRSILYILGALLIGTLLFSCGYPVTQQMGQADAGYLVFVSASNTKYKAPVQVTVNDGAQFDAKVYKSMIFSRSQEECQRYQLSTGKKAVKVTYQGKVLYNQEFVLSAQETKPIQLP